MRTIDIHAHLMPQCYWRAFDQGLEWYGYRHEPGDKVGPTVGKRNPVANPKFRFTAEERIKDMDAQGMDVHVVSVIPSLLAYKLEAAQGLQLARDVNDEIATMVRQWPQRFTGLATLPAQDVKNIH